MKRHVVCFLAAGALLVSGLAGTAAAVESTGSAPLVSTGEVADALGDVPGLLAQSDTVNTRGDADSAATSTTQGSTVDIPKDASDGVAVARADGAAFTVTLPGADEGTQGKLVAPGTVAYGSPTGSANAVQATENGGARMLTVISERGAPQEYSYGVNVEGGGQVTLTDDGGAAVIAADGTPLATVAAPWAKDANGVAVPTHFAVRDGSLVQVVEHDRPGVAYPVTADPWWSWLVTAFQWAGGGAKILVKKVGPWALVLCAVGSGWAWYRSDSKGWLRVGDAVVGCIA
ncbi:hypothetical protein OV450_3697 [Actinobacteria bacterium OV450]|nr:hypothetical protein OV450_3697 [Actinobacteria bacterium OV450]